MSLAAGETAILFFPFLVEAAAAFKDGYFWRSTLKPFPGILIGIYAYSLIAIFALLYSAHRDSSLLPRWNRRRLIQNLISLAAFLIVRMAYLAYFANRIPLAIRIPMGAYFCVGGGWLVVSAICAFYDGKILGKALLRRPGRLAWTFAALLAYPAMDLLTEVSWRQLAQSVGTSVYYVLKFVGLEVVPQLTWTRGHFTLELFHPNFGVKILSSCCGTEGFFLLLYSACLLKIALPGQLKGILGWLPWGVVLMYALNVIRIAGLFVVGAKGAVLFGSQATVNFVTEVFHSNAGWILYSVGLFCFFRRELSPTSVDERSPGIKITSPNYADATESQ